jgi:hypothetical protein
MQEQEQEQVVGQGQVVGQEGHHFMAHQALTDMEACLRLLALRWVHRLPVEEAVQAKSRVALCGRR